jgi:inosose dehydratase
MRLGIHAVLFKGRIATETDQVLSMIESSRAEAFEMGARFFGVDKGEAMSRKVSEHHLALSGLHVSNNLVDYLDRPEECHGRLVNAAKFLQFFPDKNIIHTGGLPQEQFDSPILGDERLINEKEVRKIARTLNAFAKELKEQYGVTINYHNHNWEFKNDALVYNALLEEAPDMRFALDIGWAAVSGYDPLSLIQKYPARFHYLHLRDYKKAELSGLISFKDIQMKAFCPIGEGDMNLPAIMRAVANDSFLIVEYETGEEDIARYTAAMQYLGKVRAK